MRTTNVLAAGLLLSLTTAGAAQGLFGIDWDTGNLYRVNSTNAALTLVGNTGLSQAGSLEARGGRLYSVSSGSAPVLYSIDPATAASTTIGPLGIGFVFEGALAFAPDGTAYATNQNNSSTANLFRVNINTGAATLIGVISGGSRDINGLAWRRDGQLVALDRVSNSLLAIDPATAVATPIAAVAATVGALGGMASAGDNGFFNTSGPGGSIPGSNSLYSFNLFSGAASLVGSLGPTIMGTGMGGLALFESSAQDMYGIEFDTGVLYRVSSTNAALTVVGNTGVTFLGSLEGRNGRLYGFTSGATPVLYSIDPITAVASAIGPLGVGFVFEGALVFAPDGTAYATNQNNSGAANLFRINIGTGAATLIGVISGGSRDINGLAWRRDGLLVALDRVTNSLITVDPSTAAAGTIAAVPATVGAAGGMTSAGDRGFFNTSGPGGSIAGSNSLYSFDMFSGAATLVGSFAPTISTGNGISGLARCGGSFTPYGRGCPGTNRAVPTHTGGGTPEIGQVMNWDVNHVVPNAPGVLLIGVRQAAVGLGGIGMGTCTLDVSILTTIPIALNGAGLARLQFTVANNVSLIGGRVGTQAAIVDLGTATPTKVVMSAGLETEIGGCR